MGHEVNMKTRLLALLLALIVSTPSRAQVVCVGAGCGGGTVTSPIATDPMSATGVWTFNNAANTPVTCSDGLIDSTLTAGRVTFAGTGGLLSDDADLTFATDTLTATKLSVGSGVLAAGPTVAADNTTNFLDVTGTMPAVPTATVNAVELNITGAGSAAQANRALYVNYAAGYTGATSSIALHGANSNSATGASPFILSGSIGVAGQIAGSPTVGAAFNGYVGGGTTGIGAFLQAANASTNAVGALGVATGASTNQVGGYFGLNTALPTFTSAALIADNAAVAAPIFIARDNGTAVVTIQDGGSAHRLMATKTLTESAATTFVRVAVASGARTGGVVAYCLNAADAADHQERCGSVPFAVVNKAGAETCVVGTAADAEAVSVGTLAVTWATDVATPTNGCDLQANAVSSLTQTTLNLSYTITLTGASASAVTPQ